MNGPYLPDDFWEQLDKRFDRVFKKQDEMQQELSSINAHGCAQRINDIHRIENLEKWRDKGIIGIIVIAMGVILNFFGIRTH